MSGGANINFQAVAKAMIRFVGQQLANPPVSQAIAAPGPGNISQRPFTNRAGMFKIFFVCLSSLYLGGLVAQKGASFLEENEIFVPSEDDDDD